MAIVVVVDPAPIEMLTLTITADWFVVVAWYWEKVLPPLQQVAGSRWALAPNAVDAVVDRAHGATLLPSTLTSIGLYAAYTDRTGANHLRVSGQNCRPV